MLMLLQNIILPILFSLSLWRAETPLVLKQDIDKDVNILNNTAVYISDNTTLNPSLQAIMNDMQFFMLAGNIDLAAASHSSSTKGKHEIQKWDFEEGDIKTILQITSPVALDTVITQRYLENRPPTQHRVNNKFVFRTYLVSTTNSPLKLFYLTEADQGLLEYKLDERHVQIGYPKKKEGLSDILPRFEEEIERLIKGLI
jgi:hypothetical protein